MTLSQININDSDFFIFDIYSILYRQRNAHARTRKQTHCGLLTRWFTVLIVDMMYSILLLKWTARAAYGIWSFKTTVVRRPDQRQRNKWMKYSVCVDDMDIKFSRVMSYLRVQLSARSNKFTATISINNLCRVMNSILRFGLGI